MYAGMSPITGTVHATNVGWPRIIAHRQHVDLASIFSSRASNGLFSHTVLYALASAALYRIGLASSADGARPGRIRRDGWYARGIGNRPRVLLGIFLLLFHHLLPPPTAPLCNIDILIETKSLSGVSGMYMRTYSTYLRMWY